MVRCANPDSSSAILSNPVDDDRWKFERFEADGSAPNRRVLAEQIEHEVRYAGSADLAYGFRWLIGREPGVSVDEILRDVSAQFKVKDRPLGTFKARVERLVRGVVDKSFTQLSPEDQRRMLESEGVEAEKAREVVAKLKEGGKLAVLPLLYAVLGRTLVTRLVTAMATQVIASILGPVIARQLIQQVVTKFPWWGQWLGPIVWSITLSWAVYDIQGAAYRITCPTMVYLGLIALREGPEGGDAFWQEPSDE